MGFSLTCLFVNLLMPVVCGHWFCVCEWVLLMPMLMFCCWVCGFC